MWWLIFDQPIKNGIIIYKKIRKIGKLERLENYTTDWLLDYRYFKENY